MALFNFTKKPNQTGVLNQDLESFLADYSIEVMPRTCLLYTSPSPRDVEESRMPSSA